MSTTQPPQTRTLLTRLGVALDVFQGIGAIGGGIALMLGPRGEILPLSVSQLRGSPFSSYFWPGVILFSVLGVGPLVVAALGWRRQPWAPLLTLCIGIALLIWMTVEIATIGYASRPPLQPIYLTLGAVIVLVAVAWIRESGLPFPSRSHAPV